MKIDVGDEIYFRLKNDNEIPVDHSFTSCTYDYVDKDKRNFERKAGRLLIELELQTGTR